MIIRRFGEIAVFVDLDTEKLSEETIVSRLLFA